MKTISLSNQKGGCAKTTTVWALGTGLNDRGFRVLLVDLDAQSNLSFTAGANFSPEQPTLYDYFCGKATVKDVLQNVRPNMDILTGGLLLSSADIDFTKSGREFMLCSALDKIRDNYDFCIIDTAPHLGIMTLNALVASNSVIVPMLADIYAIQGAEQLKSFIDTVTGGYRPLNADLVIEGVLITRLDERPTVTKALVNSISHVAETLETKVYNAVIHSSVSIEKSALLKSSVYEIDPQSRATQDYNSFVEEFLKEQ